MTKTISLADDAYEALVRVKRPGESFSALARRAAQELQKGPFRAAAGAWKDVDTEAVLAEIYKARDAAREPRYRV